MEAKWLENRLTAGRKETVVSNTSAASAGERSRVMGMRARNIKPGLFRNELLATQDPLFTLIFQGLWCMADREGRLEDRPAKIHININPCRPMTGTEQAIGWLAENGFIQRYEAGGVRYIQVENFLKHQNPHCKEAKSTIPAPCKHSAFPSDSGFLTPDSGFLTPDSLRSSSLGNLLPSYSDTAPGRVKNASKKEENRRSVASMAAAAVKAVPKQ
jgi:hypothetical protein